MFLFGGIAGAGGCIRSCTGQLANRPSDEFESGCALDAGQQRLLSKLIGREVIASRVRWLHKLA